MDTDCPPIQPPPIVLPADPVMAEVPARTLRWLADRDVYGERAYACWMDCDGRLKITTVRYLEAKADAEGLAAELAIAEASAREWQGVARRRPSWGLALGVALGSAALGVYAWEVAR